VNQLDECLPSKANIISPYSSDALQISGCEEGQIDFAGQALPGTPQPWQKAAAFRMMITATDAVALQENDLKL
jgi:hypothetical protein